MESNDHHLHFTKRSWKMSSCVFLLLRYWCVFPAGCLSHFQLMTLKDFIRLMQLWHSESNITWQDAYSLYATFNMSNWWPHNVNENNSHHDSVWLLYRPNKIRKTSAIMISSFSIHFQYSNNIRLIFAKAPESMLMSLFVFYFNIHKSSQLEFKLNE